MVENIYFIILGFIFLIIGANIMIKGASNIAKKFHIPEVLIGLTIVCIGTSLPELIITITSSLKGHTDLIVGNAIGSNLCNLLLILGIVSMIKPIKFDKDIVSIHLPVSIFATAIVILICNGFITNVKFGISRLEGITLILLFVIYFSFPIIIEIKDIIKSKSEKNVAKSRKDISVIKAVIFIVIGAVMLKHGGDYVTDYSTKVAEYFNISERIIGLTIIAIGTALPELVTSIVAVTKKDAGLAVGNLIGSSMLNLWLILGIGAAISPLSFSVEFNNTLAILMGTVSLIWIFMFIGKKGTLTRGKGIVLFLIFILYIVNLFIT